LRESAFRFALLAAGVAGVAYEEFRYWLYPWGWTREDLERLLRSESRSGTVELFEGPKGIVRLRLTALGERLLAAPRTPSTGTA
jgi:hypothetical protein